MSSLAFAKLAATPTETTWSQAYNAGNLFACLSLAKKEVAEDVMLSSIGKDMFSSLQSEFFTLENKDLQSIKEAIANSTHTIPSSVTGGFCLVYFKNNILYVFIFGRGSIIMKRGDKIGTLLEGDNDLEIKSASGYVENEDIIVIQTSQFSKDMADDTISQALELSLPNDIAEALSPTMHEKDDGGQAAIIVTYHDTQNPIIHRDEAQEIMTPEPAFDELSEPDKETQTTVGIPPAPVEIHHEAPKEFERQKHNFTHSLSSRASNLLKKPTFLKNSFFANMTHRNKLFLSIAIILVVILALSVSLSKKKEETTKTTALFQSVYDPALKDYEDGKSVQSINAAFARDDFQKAKQKLSDGKDKFKTDSKEGKQISDLLSKVEAELGGSTSANVITPKETKVDSNNVLAIEKANSDGIAFSPDKDSVDYISSSAVVSVDKDGKKKDIIKNDKDWAQAVGLATYQGNIFVLDQKNGVLKYSAGANGFGKSSYFKGTGPDLSSANAIAIDGSVWILLSDSSILKYTRGASDGFKVKALDKQFKNPTRLATGTDLENLYILDPGNARIVKISKEGDYKTQYNADILKNAKDLTVSEKDGTITVLSQGKFWTIPL